MTISVYDYGIGLLPEDLVSVQASLECYPPPDGMRHFGLYNIDRRIKNYFGESFGLTIDSEFGEYTKVTLRFPELHPDKASPNSSEERSALCIK